MLGRCMVGRRSQRALLPLAFALGTLTLAQESKAQQHTFYLDRLTVGGAPEDGLGIYRPVTADRTIFFGQMALGFSLNPLRIATITEASRARSQTGNTVSTQLIDYATIGAQFADRITLSATLPVAFFESGADPRPTGTGNGIALETVAAHDLRLDGRIRVYSNEKRTFHLGIGGVYYAATGNAFSFASDAGGHGGFEAAIEGKAGDLILVGNAGVHFRPYGALGLLGVGDELVVRAGAFYPMRNGRVRIGGQVFGTTGLGDVKTQKAGTQSSFLASRNTPFEWLAEGRFALDEAQQAWLGVGGGTRLSSGYGAPDFRLLAAIGYHFAIAESLISEAQPTVRVRPRYEEMDSDGDGIPDSEDLCADEREDGLPPDPTDGCAQPPEPAPETPTPQKVEPEVTDTDNDGILDLVDACPREPGVPSQDPARHGCPQFIKREEGSSKIEILERIEFDTNKATIKPNSLPILDEVAKLILANPDIARVDIEGHTDDRGATKRNNELSQARAESVRHYLISQGVGPERLTAKGYGPSKPIDTNATALGRQKNRRVEFLVTQGSTP